jgi:hypothetical protein
VRRPLRRWLARIRRLPLSDGNWAYSRTAQQDDPVQGWKLHLSATILSASDVFARAEPILRDNNALFKLPCRLDLLKSLNSGLPDFSQIGKFLTIYPRSTEEALKLARDLHRVTRGLPGPHVPFDTRYRKSSLVYYRYGAFHPSPDGEPGLIRAPGGRRYRDKRAPGHAVPPWQKDPFQKSRARNSIWRGLIGRNLLVFNAKTQRGKGGVYEAIDLSVSPVRRVIIKEGRRHGETNWDGRDGYSLVNHEGRVLRKLRKAGLPVPEVFREFTKNGNRYLVLEQIIGQPLIPAKRLHPPRTSYRRAEMILKLLGPLLSKMHAAGWIWRDCKPSHIFIHEGKVRLIDFEGVCGINQTELLPWGSLDYIPPPYRSQFSRRVGALEDDYALGVIAFQFLSGKFPPNSSARRSSIYKAARCPDSLRNRIEDLLQLQ